LRARRPLGTALAFQAGLVGLGVALAVLLGLAPWQDIRVSGAAFALALLGTLPPAALLLLAPQGRWRWADELTDLVRRFVRLLFRDAPPGTLVLVAVLAGIGEELLFRGVVQNGLAQAWHPGPALVLASLLFGLAHAISLAYLLAASLIGFYLGLFYHLTGNLLVPILIHALYDWIAFHFYLRRPSGGNALR